MSAEDKRTPIGVEGPGKIGKRFIYHAIHNLPLGLDVKALAYKPPDKKFKDTFDTYAQAVGESLIVDSDYGAPLDDRVNYDPPSREITINGQGMKFFAIEDPAQIPWEGTPVEIVVDTVREHENPADARLNLRSEGHPHTVVITSNGKDGIPIYVFGVNHPHYLHQKPDVLATGSCSTNCFALGLNPFIRSNLGIRTVEALSNHDITGDNQIYDRVAKGLRGRGSVGNILRDKTGAADSLFRVYPELQKELTEEPDIRAYRMVADASLLEVTLRLERSVSREGIVQMFEEAADTYLKGSLAYSPYELTPSDIKGCPRGAIIPKPFIEVSRDGHKVRFIALYDNVDGYVNQAMLLTRFVGQNRLAA